MGYKYQKDSSVCYMELVEFFHMETGIWVGDMENLDEMLLSADPKYIPNTNRKGAVNNIVYNIDSGWKWSPDEAAYFETLRRASSTVGKQKKGKIARK